LLLNRQTPSGFKLGKQTLLWGKRICMESRGVCQQAPKILTILNSALEGYVTASADYIKSFAGPLENNFFHPVLFPVYKTQEQ